MKERPNIVIFFVDDMGYGDASCLNPNGKIKTPNIDKLASRGMKFTDAHSTSAVCSPSRYGLLTGRYNWRSSLQKGIVEPYGEPLIDKDRLTIAKMLKDKGYNTGMIGKWHLGMGWDFEIENASDYYGEYNKLIKQIKNLQKEWKENFSKPVYGGPKAAGFDYSFGVDVPNWPPYCYIENSMTVGQPDRWLDDYLIGDNMGSIMGPAMPYWNFHQLLPTFSKKADEYITAQAKEDEPFFLYFASTSPHTPIAVNKEYIGASGLNNLYADFVIETDAILGDVMDSLDKNNLTDDTLIIFASDNGCAYYIGLDDLVAQGHDPSNGFRGSKTDIWDGGHRIPCVMSWPNAIKSNTSCDELICLSDIYATVAEIVNDKIPDNTAEDSYSLMSLFNQEDNYMRNSAINHSVTGKFAIRTREWKLILTPGSGGYLSNVGNDPDAIKQGLPPLQLYNMKDDPSESNNIYKEHPQKVRELLSQLNEIVENGRSTDGAYQKNDVPVDIWKLDKSYGDVEDVLDDL